MYVRLFPYRFSLFTVILFLISGCIKNNITGTNSGTPPQQPQATSVGTTTGDQVSQVIGPGGGSIASSDNSVELVIPAGALSSSTTITMQPITNNCPGGLTTGFRFGPDGLHFNQPATMKIHYTADILGSVFSDFMGIAYQDSSGYWHRIKELTNDTVNKVLTATIKHFTDYAPFSLLIIHPPAATLRPTQTLNLQVQVAESDDDDLPPLSGPDGPPDVTADPYIIVYKDGKCNWEINGGQQSASAGQFITDNGTLNITYQAPDQVPQTGNPVAVSATIDMGGMKLDGKKYNKTILVSNITISDKLVYQVDLKMDDDGTGESPSGTLNVEYRDEVTFKLTMVYAVNQGVDTAIFSDIQNQAPTIDPSYYQDKSGCSSCSVTYTWQSDPNGMINIDGGHGIGTSGPQGENISLTFSGNGTSPKWQTVICGDFGCATSYSGGTSSGNFPYGMEFTDTKEQQSVVLTSNPVSGLPVITAAITPQH